MGRTLAVVNQKGGVGKTTTAINLAAALALEGMACLLLDIDPQANTTAGFGIARDEARLSTYDVLVNDAAIANAILKTELDLLQIVPASKDLVGATVELIEQDGRAFKLRTALEPHKAFYDFLLLDCPPALDLLTLNALVAADGLIVPLQAEYFALEGISELMHTLERVQESFNPALVVEGILLTMYDDRTNLTQQVSSNLREHFGAKVFKTTIPRNVRLAEAPSYGRPVALYDPRSRGAESYRELALEVLERNRLTSRRLPKPSSNANAVAAAAAKTGAATGTATSTTAATAANQRPVRFWPYA